MSGFLDRLGSGAARHPWRVLAAWALVLAVVSGLASVFGGTLTDNHAIPGSSSQRASDLLTKRFPTMAGTSARVVAQVDSGAVDPTALDSSRRRLAAIPHVSGVSEPLVSADRRTALLTVQYDVRITELPDESGLPALEQATAGLEAQAATRVAVGGEVPEALQEPDGRAELVGMSAAVVILLVAFGSLVAAGLPLLVALVGLGLGSGGITLLAALTEVSPTTPTLATMVGLGVGIDYALFIVTRHRDGLAAGLSVANAAGRANATAGHSVVLAGVTVLLAITGLQFAGVPNFAAMGFGTALAVLATVLAAVTLLPAVLGLAGHRVHGRRSRRLDGPRPSASHSATAARLATLVSRRPLPWAVAAVGVLAVMAAPAAGMNIGQSDAGLEPESTQIRQAYDMAAAAFGPGVNGPLVVAVDLQKVPEGGLDALSHALSEEVGVASVSDSVVSPDGTAAVLTVIPTTGPQDDRTTALVQTIREEVLPAGADVTGFTAAMIDLSEVLASHLPVVIAVVIATSVLLLVVAFRSLVVPLKAAVVNLLSVFAAFGVMTAAFQTEVGSRLMGLPGEAPIAAYVPVLMFAVLFGLSMDYEVFLIGRMREELLRTGDPRQAVVAGLSGTARVITSAALIMVAVFLGFALDPSVVVKMIGVGMAVAIAVDATIIRLVLVPASMALLGQSAWYLPSWLDRLLPQPSSAAQQEQRPGSTVSSASTKAPVTTGAVG